MATNAGKRCSSGQSAQYFGASKNWHSNASAATWYGICAQRMEVGLSKMAAKLSGCLACVALVYSTQCAAHIARLGHKMDLYAIETMRFRQPTLKRLQTT